jgi:hypothetical protein
MFRSASSRNRRLWWDRPAPVFFTPAGVLSVKWARWWWVTEPGHSSECGCNPLERSDSSDEEPFRRRNGHRAHVIPNRQRSVADLGRPELRFGLTNGGIGPS